MHTSSRNACIAKFSCLLALPACFFWLCWSDSVLSVDLYLGLNWQINFVSIGLFPVPHLSPKYLLLNCNNAVLKEVVLGICQKNSMQRPAVAESNMHVSVGVYRCADICMHMHVYICVCVCMYKNCRITSGGRVLLEVILSGCPSPHWKLDESYSGYCI